VECMTVPVKLTATGGMYDSTSKVNCYWCLCQLNVRKLFIL